MSDAIVLGGRYIARGTAHNTQNQVRDGAEVRVSFLGGADVSFEIVAKNGNLPMRSLVAESGLFGANFTLDRTTAANRGYVRSKHFTTRYK